MMDAKSGPEDGLEEGNQQTPGSALLPGLYLCNSVSCTLAGYQVSILPHRLAST